MLISLSSAAIAENREKPQIFSRSNQEVHFHAKVRGTARGVALLFLKRWRCIEASTENGPVSAELSVGNWVAPAGRSLRSRRNLCFDENLSLAGGDLDLSPLESARLFKFQFELFAKKCRALGTPLEFHQDALHVRLDLQYSGDLHKDVNSGRIVPRFISTDHLPAELELVG